MPQHRAIVKLVSAAVLLCSSLAWSASCTGSSYVPGTGGAPAVGGGTPDGAADGGGASDGGGTADGGGTGDGGGTADGGGPPPGDGGATTLSDFSSFPNAPGQTDATPGIVQAAPSIVQDRKPGAAGDLMMLVWGSSAWGLYVSPDEGASWRYVTGPGSSTGTHTGGLAQDTVNFNLHVLMNSDADSNLYYSRIHLTRDGNGHVSGWTWDASHILVTAAPKDTSGGDATDVKFQITEAIDGQGNHLLATAYLYSYQAANGSTHYSRVAAKKTTAAAGVTPAATADFVKLDGTAGETIVSDLSGIYTGSASYEIHDLVMNIAQHPVDKSINVFRGAMEGSLGSMVRRWRYTTGASSTFALDSAVNGAILLADGAFGGPSFGGTFVTQDSIWIAAVDPSNNLRIDRIDATGTYQASAIGGPGRSAYTAYVNVALNQLQNEAWAMWVDANAGSETWAGHAVWNGAAWTWDHVQRVSSVDMGGFGPSAYYRGGLAIAERSVTNVNGELQVIRTAQP